MLDLDFDFGIFYYMQWICFSKKTRGASVVDGIMFNPDSLLSISISCREQQLLLLLFTTRNGNAQGSFHRDEGDSIVMRVIINQYGENCHCQDVGVHMNPTL